MKRIFFLSLILSTFGGYSQKKVLQAQSSSEKINIDGKLNETVWESANVASDFIMYDPDNGKPIPDNKKTQIKVIYDNDALYVAAIMHDEAPEKILKEFNPRDNFGTSDLFGVFINGYNDGQQNFEFFVTAADGQGDCIMTDANGEDYSWDSVWESKAVITNIGWIVEMKIPYAALRFTEENKQTWGINFFREIKRDRLKYTWNFIDTKIKTFTQQNGILEGIENIKPPVRLFILPYSSFYLNADAKQKTYGTIKGGLDIKYGINDAFTLDAILVPDFGQTKYDDQILNLGPFEQEFNENRPFFTEGTDLFKKGKLFYSRRIGGKPTEKASIKENEEIIEAPLSVNLINALKISGRTKGGLGIGVLNAITEKTYTTIKDTITQETRKEIVEPLANYNVLVLDQRFKKNSSISFINTNVTRNTQYRDANVSALAWDLNTKKNSYNLSGSFKYSYVNDTEDKKGVFSNLSFAKTNGKYRYSLGADYITKGFDSNDLGIIFETNYYSSTNNFNYRILNPTKHFNSFRINFNTYIQFQKETGKIQKGNFDTNLNFKTLKNDYYEIGAKVKPINSYDYYEPRTDNCYVTTPKEIESWFILSTNYNRKFAIDVDTSIAFMDESGRTTYGIDLGPRYRFTDKLSLVYNFSFLRKNNNKGYADRVSDDNILTPDAIVFANRNVITYSNTLTGKYSLNSRMTFNLSLRQYWSYAENKNFLSLQPDGSLIDYNGYNENRNSSFYSWNGDISYSWWFAPGSQISVLYLNNAANFERDINKKYSKNVTDLLTNDVLKHVFSISIRYFIDYNDIKNKI